MLDAVPETDGLPRLLDAAEALSGLPLSQIALEGPVGALSDTRAAQPLLYLADWAWGQAVLDAGVQPFVVAGHSLGELVALAIAQVYSVEAGLELVIARSRLMAEATTTAPGAMSAVIGLDSTDIARVVDDVDGVWVANDNAPGQVVISGTQAGIATAEARLRDANARKIVPLAVSGAFHSPLMSQAAEEFASLLDEAEFSDATVPVVQNAAPSATVEGDLIKSRLVEQMSSPVRWTETMRLIAGEPGALVVEAGPGSVLAGLARRVEGLSAISAEQAGIERVLEEVERDA